MQRLSWCGKKLETGKLLEYYLARGHIGLYKTVEFKRKDRAAMWYILGVEWNNLMGSED